MWQYYCTIIVIVMLFCCILYASAEGTSPLSYLSVDGTAVDLKWGIVKTEVQRIFKMKKFSRGTLGIVIYTFKPSQTDAKSVQFCGMELTELRTDYENMSAAAGLTRVIGTAKGATAYNIIRDVLTTAFGDPQVTTGPWYGAGVYVHGVPIPTEGIYNLVCQWDAEDASVAIEGPSLDKESIKADAKDITITIWKTE